MEAHNITNASFKGVFGMYMYIKMIHIMIVDLCNMIITLSILLIAHRYVLPSSMSVYIHIGGISHPTI